MNLGQTEGAKIEVGEGEEGRVLLDLEHLEFLVRPPIY